MQKIKLCYVDNIASHYRKAIFLLMDEAFNCDYIFGADLDDIKQMDTSLLHGMVKKTKIRKLWGGWSWQPCVVGSLLNSYDSYLLIGDTRSLSTWVFAFLSRIIAPTKKTYFWSHGWYGKEKTLERLLKKVFFRLPNGGVFLYGNYARELMIKEGFNPQKLFVIHNSLDYDNQLALRKVVQQSDIYKKHFDNDNPNLFFIGRLTPIKHLDMILQALAILRKKGRAYNITYIGDGTEKEKLLSLTRELSLENNVWFYGACYDEKTIGEMIFNADLCVAPGNIGLTAMHSLVFGTPVLTHNDFAHQMPEFEAIKEGVTGAFFNYGNVESLSDIIDKWFITHSDRECIRDFCYREIDEKWTPQFQIKVLKKYLK